MNELGRGKGIGTVRVPSQARAIQRREAIHQAAKLEFAERGYEATTAKTIAARAEVATGTFYQYFTDKDDLLRQLAIERYRALEETFLFLDADIFFRGGRDGASIRENIKRNIAAVLAYHRTDPGLHPLITSRRVSDKVLDTIAAESNERIIQRIEALVSRVGFGGDVRAMAFFLFCTVESVILKHLAGASRVSDERLIDALTGAIISLVFPATPG